MPHIRIYHPAERAFTDAKDRKGLADNITNMYTSSGIPAFYVIVHFVPVPSTHFFVGGRNGDSDQGNADPSQPPMIRVNVDHIARAMATIESQKYFFTRALKPYIADKGYDWEYYNMVESPKEYGKVNGIYLPPIGGEVEQRWAKENRPSPYEGMEEPSPMNLV
ncbi:Tautomerase [Botryosphaeria dothidea]|uniref:Tautomerase n=1 Tax=Botryosphaeria dothidea TaxID=55169 RepID=A0A8H4NDU5_9PEZI|nr:Tautomerase [Botryosphaeria dothidea]